jgi:hypothetical protein
MDNWRFVAKDTLSQTEVIGLIYKGSHGPAVGEWTARLYSAGEVSLISLLENRKENGMRGIYMVVIVEPQKEKVKGPFFVIAKSAESAKFRAANEAGIEDIEDYDIVPVRLGDVREKKVVQEVKIVK